MKTNIIYNSISEKSSENALLCRQSFNNFKGWDVEIFDGCNPLNLHKYHNKYNLKTTERTLHQDRPSVKIHSKKCCFYSHYELWNRCAKSGKNMVIVEHDTECVLDNNIPEFDPKEKLAVQLSTDTILWNWPWYNTKKNKEKYKKNGNGVHEIFYAQPNGVKCMSGNTAYLITPAACEHLIEDCIKNGWTQNDLLINTNQFPLYYYTPSPIAYIKSRELRSSSVGVIKDFIK